MKSRVLVGHGDTTRLLALIDVDAPGSRSG
jgi:hypothetical protein